MGAPSLWCSHTQCIVGILSAVFWHPWKNVTITNLYITNHVTNLYFSEYGTLPLPPLSTALTKPLSAILWAWLKWIIWLICHIVRLIWFSFPFIPHRMSCDIRVIHSAVFPHFFLLFLSFFEVVYARCDFISELFVSGRGVSLCTLEIIWSRATMSGEMINCGDVFSLQSGSICLHNDKTLS